MRRIAPVLLAVGLLLACCGSTLASGSEMTSAGAVGEELVRQLWQDFAEADTEAIQTYISPGFQSIHEDGARDAADEIELVKNLDLGEYTLSDFQVSEAGPVLIITYFVAVSETIGGQRLSSAPAARLSAFLQTEDGWQWICHANLNPMR